VSDGETVPSVRQQVDDALPEILQKTDSELEDEVGRFVKATLPNLASKGTRGRSLRDLGRRFVDFPEIRQVVCNAWQNGSIKDDLTPSNVAMLVGLLLTTLHIAAPPVIGLTFVAVLILKKSLRAYCQGYPAEPLT